MRNKVFLLAALVGVASCNDATGPSESHPPVPAAAVIPEAAPARIARDRYIVVLKDPEVGSAVIREHALSPRHRYSRALNGFSVTLLINS